MFQCEVEYNPAYPYTRREMIALIKPHQELLCFFAKAAGHNRCVLGLDFDNYDPASRMIPVFIIPPEAVNTVVAVEGPKFKKAYRASRVGRNIIVTFTAPQGRGWFTLAWRLDTTRVFEA